MSEPFSFAVVRQSSAPVEAVFELLADIPRWHEWAGPLVRSSARERDGSPDPNGVGAMRRLGSAPFYSREEIVEFVPPTRLVYVLRSGMPVRDYRSEVDLSDDGRGGTTISWRSTFRPAIPGSGAVFRALLRTIVTGFATRLARHAAGS